MAFFTQIPPIPFRELLDDLIDEHIGPETDEDIIEVLQAKIEQMRNPNADEPG